MRLTVTLEASRLVRAPRPVVWRVFSDLTAWPEWNPLCSKATIEPRRAGQAAPLEQEGLGFSFGLRPLGWPVTVRATVRAARPGELVAWQGRCWGVTSLHTYTFTDAPGGTLVHSHEEITGWTLLFLRAFYAPRRLSELNHQWLKALAQRSESLAGGRRV